jgi:uncharacterized protein YkwD
MRAFGWTLGPRSGTATREETVRRITTLLLCSLPIGLGACQSLPLRSDLGAVSAPASAAPVAAASPGRAEAGTFAVPRLTPELRAGVEADFLRESNELRATGGVDPLVRDPRLDRAARRYAEHLAARHMLEHESDIPELRTPELRAAAEGAQERFVGETLALLASTPETAARRTVHLWSESPDHRRVMLRKTYRRAGIGVAMDEERVWYIVQMYAPGE